MIFDFFGDLNWLAIVVAAVAWFIFSAVWYSVPPLSAAWQREAKVTMAEDGPPLVTLLIPTFVVYLVTTVAIALLAAALGSTTFGEGLALGVVLGVAFGVGGALVNQLYERKGPMYWLVNGLNGVVAYSIVAVIVSVWN